MDWQLVLVYLVALITLLFVLRWLVSIFHRAGGQKKTSCMGCDQCALADLMEKEKVKNQHRKEDN